MHIPVETSFQTATVAILSPAKNKSSFSLTFGSEFVVLCVDHHDWSEMALQRNFNVPLYENFLRFTDGLVSLI